MRYVYLALIIVVTLAVVAFTVQNIGSVTVSFFSSSMTLPLSVLTIGVYLLGMLTGGLLLSAIRYWVRGATKSIEPASASAALIKH